MKKKDESNQAVLTRAWFAFWRAWRLLLAALCALVLIAVWTNPSAQDHGRIADRIGAETALEKQSPGDEDWKMILETTYHSDPPDWALERWQQLGSLSYCDYWVFSTWNPSGTTGGAWTVGFFGFIWRRW